ncbi:conserved hypothetical protein [Candidatus Desulfarcum epimagneticum]|uniref:Uncharacterized protein n=1 Tax=uncultured Desulfobacteraceae bacterium TaxID=218296 RepID=A0A484HI97_9BACT|nr:conserved hypothetical protein [uncultured Desulfobacteraceae bacterium]
MNIFVLDTDIEKCAEFHCDQHVVKMTLESVQILCSALSKKNFETPYRPTHQKHPCVLWAEESYDNFEWLSKLAYALNDEYRYRYRRSHDHKSIDALRSVSDMEYERKGLTPFAQAMPEQYRVPGYPVKAYRRFYLGEKMGFAKWTRRGIPYWVKETSDRGMGLKPDP